MSSHDILEGGLLKGYDQIKEHAGQLPLSEAVYLILVSLASEPRHGYAILKEVADLSGGRVSLSTGTLYGAVKRLLADGWITRTPDPEPDETRRERKFYSLTGRGKRVLRAETQRLSHLSELARLRLEKEARSASD